MIPSLHPFSSYLTPNWCHETYILNFKKANAVTVFFSMPSIDSLKSQLSRLKLDWNEFQIPGPSIRVREEGGGGGEGWGFWPKFCQKPLPRNNLFSNFVFCQKTQKFPPQGQGSYVKCSYLEAMLFILGIHRDQTRQKNCTSPSLRNTEIILPINSTKSNSDKY